MKKFLAILLVMLLALTGCGTKTDDTPKGETGSTYKIGTAILTNESTKDAADEDGQFEVNSYYATVVMEDDKFVNVYIDVAQNKVKINAADELTGFEGKGTKKELGDDYNMKTYGNAVAEWYEQIESLEAWMLGKTLVEVLAMDTYEKDANHPEVPNEEDLKTSVTIDVSAYLSVVEKAVSNAVEVKDVVKVGTASVSSANKDKLEINTNVGAVALNGAGEVVYAYIDAAQNGAEAAAGVITGKEMNSTKKELGDDYNMKKFGNAVAEWFEQIESFEKYAIGKTAADIVAIPRTEGVADVEDLKTTVTIGIDGYVEVINKAAEQAVNVK